MQKQIEFKENCFDLLRLVAAITVMLSHSFRWFGIEKPIWSLCFTDGSVGVITFFTISGYLIMASWENCLKFQKPWKRYIYNRVFRIFPALIFSFLFLIILDIVIYGTSFTFEPGIIYGFIQYCFRFNGAPFSVGFTNGVLWTLRDEVILYGLVPFLYNVLKKLSIKKWCILIFTCWLFNVFDKQIVTYTSISGDSFIVLMYEYLIGIFVYFHKDRILPVISNKKFLLPFGVVWMIWFCVLSFSGIEHNGMLLLGGEMHNPTLGITLPWLIIGLGYSENVHLRIDLSYGIYLYHMLLIWPAIYLGLTKVADMVLVWLLVIVVACCSYFAVEQNFAKVKSRIIGDTFEIKKNTTN